MRELQAPARSGENNMRHSPVYRWSRPKHVVSDGLMTLAEDKRPEANLRIELRQYALQNLSIVLWSTLLEQSVGHRIKSLKQCQISTIINQARALTSATNLLSIRDTRVFLPALTALTEPGTLWQRIKCDPSPEWRVALHTYPVAAIIPRLVFLRCIGV